MQQLILELTLDRKIDFEHYISAHNNEALNALRAMAQHQPPEPLLYLWGERSCGKTHLLQACVSAAYQTGINAIYLHGRQTPTQDDNNAQLIAVDDVEQLTAEQQIWLFTLINRARDSSGVMRVLCAGNTAPAQLPLRADVTSRLGWHLVYHIQPLTDQDKHLALIQWANRRGFTLTAELADYLMHHWRRDLPSLMQLLDQVDYYSLQSKRAITLPLIREVLVRQP